MSHVTRTLKTDHLSNPIGSEGTVLLDWKDASQEELELKQSMEWLFSKHPKLLDFLFESSSPRLRDEPQKLLAEAEVFSSGERTLIQVALDLWDGSGKALFLDVIHILDEDNKKMLFLVLQYLKQIQVVGALGLSTIKTGSLELGEVPTASGDSITFSDNARTG